MLWKKPGDSPSSAPTYAQVPSKLAAATHVGDGWQVESDNSKPEYIVHPPVGSIAEVRTKVGALAKFATDLAAGCKDPNKDPDKPSYFLASKLGWKATGKGGEELVIQPFQENATLPIWADPQCTIGVSVARLDDLFHFLARPAARAKELEDLKDASFKRTFDPAVMDPTKSAAVLAGKKPFAPSQNVLEYYQAQGDLSGRAAKARAAVAALKLPGTMPKLKGLLTLMAQYLLQMDTDFGGKLTYPKSAFPVMDRSDFTMLFTTLDDKEQAWFLEAVGFGNESADSLIARIKKPKKIKSTKTEMFDSTRSPVGKDEPKLGLLFGAGGLLEQLGLDPSGSKPMFREGYEVVQEKNRKSKGPTASEWFRSIPYGYKAAFGDWVKADKLSPPPGWPDRNEPMPEGEFHHAMGLLHRLEEGNRAILEFRRFARKVPAHLWVDHAVAMATIVEAVTGPLKETPPPSVTAPLSKPAPMDTTPTVPVVSTPTVPVLTVPSTPLAPTVSIPTPMMAPLHPPTPSVGTTGGRKRKPSTSTPPEGEKKARTGPPPHPPIVTTDPTAHFMDATPVWTRGIGAEVTTHEGIRYRLQRHDAGTYTFAAI
jgi:hypothetical protein